MIIKLLNFSIYMKNPKKKIANIFKRI